MPIFSLIYNGIFLLILPKAILLFFSAPLYITCSYELIALVQLPSLFSKFFLLYECVCIIIFSKYISSVYQNITVWNNSMCVINQQILFSHFMLIHTQVGIWWWFWERIKQLYHIPKMLLILKFLYVVIWISNLLLVKVVSLSSIIALHDFNIFMICRVRLSLGEKRNQNL